MGYLHEGHLRLVDRARELAERGGRDARLVEVILRESSFDPVIDLPVRRIVSMEYSESNTTQRGEIVGTIPGDVLLPYAHQRYDHLAPRRPGKGTPAPGL